ncbi:hypothetical protein HMI56_000752 [Coelomomyces lativittatus]|nr:hypothetical protein HMI56_000752 [Coelomomyces lativittatus]
MQIQDKISKCVLDSYSKHIRKSKKNTRLPENGHRTCLAGIVVENGNQELICLAMGTGVKCLNIKSVSICKVNDSHAEILCKRAFRRFLLEEVAETIKTDSSFILEYDGNSHIRFRLKPGLKFHFYISQPPCGDASMETLEARVNIESEMEIQRTHFKRMQQDCNFNLIRGRDVFYQYGSLRTKPGRSDSIQTYSHSCSDKILLWQCIGIQGALLSQLIPDPIVFDSITISQPAHIHSIERALFQRCWQHILKPPTFYTTILKIEDSQLLTMILSNSRIASPSHEGVINLFYF